MSLQEIFPHARFSPPATEDTIAKAESTLEMKLPEVLRDIYLQCDGFREDRGNAKYLFSLLDEDFVGLLVTMTKHFWHEVTAPCLTPFVFFGSSSGDECWGINLQHPDEIIAYHHMGDQ